MGSENLMDKLHGKEKAGIVVAALVLITVSALAGFYGAEQGVVSEPLELGEEVSEDEIESNVMELLEQDFAAQEEQMMMAAEQEGFDSEEIYIDGEVSSISESEFGNLLEVTVTIEGNVPGMGGQMEEITQQDSLFISNDGRYVFHPPMDLDDMGQAQQPAPEGMEDEIDQEDLEEQLQEQLEGDLEEDLEEEPEEE